MTMKHNGPWDCLIVSDTVSKQANPSSPKTSTANGNTNGINMYRLSLYAGTVYSSNC